MRGQRQSSRFGVFTLAAAILLLAGTCYSQEASSSAASAVEEGASAAKPLPDIVDLMRDVEKHQRDEEEIRKKYMWKVKTVDEDTDGKGNVKKASTSVYEFYFVEEEMVARLIEKDGKPPTDKERAKQDEEMAKQIRKAKERREKRERGEDTVTVSRILELGTFSNLRRETYGGRPALVADYVGDKKAKPRNSYEGAFRYMAGTVWVDESTRNLVRVEGQFVDTYNVGGGLVVHVGKGLKFFMRKTRINNEIWMPAEAGGQGSIRAMLFFHISGRKHATFYDYRKLKTSSTILPGVTKVEEGQPEGSAPAPEPIPQQ